MPSRFFLRCAGLTVAFSSGIAVAQTGGDYDLTWSTIDGGGETFSTGGDYELGGTIGQPDAGAMTGGDYALTGGFWFGMPETTPPASIPTTSYQGMVVTLLLVLVAGALIIRRTPPARAGA